MQQRRTPAGQVPGGRTHRTGHPARTRGTLRSSVVGRDPGVRTEPATPAARGGSPGSAGARSSGARSGGARSAEAGRSAKRPAAARRAAAAGAVKRTPAPQPRRLTRRATVLAGLLIALLLAYAYPVRVYLSQQAEIATLEQRQSEQRRRIAHLAEERAKWDDDEYVRAQARRLHYFLPGEVPYVVVDPNAAADSPGGDPAAGQRRQTRPWYGGLWSSLDAANRAPAQ
jgi:cell division protein FtsB